MNIETYKQWINIKGELNMKRKKLYYLLITFIISICLVICLVILTLEFTLIVVSDMPLIFLVYFMLTFSVMVSILAVIKNKKSKTNLYGLLSTTTALIVVLSFIFSLFGTMQLMKIVAYIIFIFTFIMFPFFCVVWSKYEKEEMETKL